MLSTDERTAVRDHIIATPELVALAEDARDGEIADVLNALTEDGVRSITRVEALKWAAGSGRFDRIKAASVLGTSTAAIRSRCLVLLEIISGGIDVGDAGITGFLDQLVVDAVLTAADKNALLAAAFDKVSKAHQLIGRSITATEVGECR